MLELDTARYFLVHLRHGSPGAEIVHRVDVDAVHLGRCSHGGGVELGVVVIQKDHGRLGVVVVQTDHGGLGVVVAQTDHGRPEVVVVQDPGLLVVVVGGSAEEVLLSLAGALLPLLVVGRRAVLFTAPPSL